MSFTALVQHLIEKFINPTLANHCSGVFYTGSNYEYCGIQRSSDYDLQFRLTMPKRKFNNLTLISDKAVVEVWEDEPGWARIKGGPPELLTDDGYMSAVEVRCNFIIAYTRKSRIYQADLPA